MRNLPKYITLLKGLNTSSADTAVLSHYRHLETIIFTGRVYGRTASYLNIDLIQITNTPFDLDNLPLNLTFYSNILAANRYTNSTSSHYPPQLSVMHSYDHPVSDIRNFPRNVSYNVWDIVNRTSPHIYASPAYTYYLKRAHPFGIVLYQPLDQCSHLPLALRSFTFCYTTLYVAQSYYDKYDYIPLKCTWVFDGLRNTVMEFILCPNIPPSKHSLGYCQGGYMVG
jgi:hypothetical protein